MAKTTRSSINFITKVLLIFFFNVVDVVFSEMEDEATRELYIIEGKVTLPDSYLSNNWQSLTRILVNGGDYLGYLKEDGSFVITGVPSGSYVVEVSNPDFAYEPVRVEINSRGKFRARRVNYVQTSQVVQVPYPMKMRPVMKHRYFQVREQWRVTDFLFNPMVLMMVLPLLLIMVLPKMMNDPETRKEMEQINNLTKYDMPEMSEVLTSFFAGGEKQRGGGGGGGSGARAMKAGKKRQ
ncbi:ER membrane protein complex subunit 7 homolog isoform X1 [Hetaerina americana]|uniref:ER membrane protein complex subunit 7 homolog isoform X1 n=1 Tax=Hetaerina americana TaxID=62018 RepID=UPI003A7F5C92